MLIGGHTPKLVILSTQVSVMSPEADVPQYLFAMNLAIDFVFWADLILQFFLGFADERPNVRVCAFMIRRLSCGDVRCQELV
jgi:hypothetical protein